MSDPARDALWQILRIFEEEGAAYESELQSLDIQAIAREALAALPRNRWAALTDAELDTLNSILTDYLNDWTITTWPAEATTIRDAVAAEHARREAKP